MAVDVLTEDWQTLDVALGGLDNLLGQLETYDRLRQLLFAEICRVAILVLDSRQDRQQCWQKICRAVAAGGGNEVHARRAGVVDLFRRDLANLNRVGQLTRVAAQVIGKEVPRASEIPEAVAEWERFQTEILDRWKTLEDLEELVVEYYPLSASKLEELAARYPAPQAWYDEEPTPS